MRSSRLAAAALGAVLLLGLVGCAPGALLPTEPEPPAEPTPSAPPTLPPLPSETLRYPEACLTPDEAASISGLRLAALLDAEDGGTGALSCLYTGEGAPEDADRLRWSIEDQPEAPGVGTDIAGVGDWAEHMDNGDYSELWVGLDGRALHILARPALDPEALGGIATALLSR